MEFKHVGRRIIGAVVLVILIVLCAAPGVSASGPFAVSYVYEGETLYVRVRVPSDGKLQIQYNAIRNDGLKHPGGRKEKHFDMKSGENTVSLSPMEASGHLLMLTFDGNKKTLLANRGSWFAGKDGVRAALSPVEAGAAYAGEVGLVDSGCAASVEGFSKPTRAVLGRTFGPDDGRGIKLEKRYRAVAFDAASTVGPVKVTLTERLEDDRIRYFDYSVMLDKENKRYVIPFEKFISRDREVRTISSMHSFSLMTQRAVEKGDRIAVTRLILTEGGPYVAAIERTKHHKYRLTVGGRMENSATLHSQDDAGHETVHSLQGRTVPISEDVRRVWLCYLDSDSSVPPKPEPESIRATICDPPDAPVTSYGVLSGAKDSFIVDKFETNVPVNSFRLPYVAFGSSDAVESAVDTGRQDGALRLTYYPEAPEDYAGYLTYLPPGAASSYKTLTVSVRGSLPPGALSAGIKDQNGEEARIPFISYWPGDETAVNPLYDLSGMNEAGMTDAEGFKTVAFPLDAFRAAFYNVFEGHAELRDISGISITMGFSGKEVFHEMEIKQVRLTRDVVPITVTAFDGDLYGINALGGVNFDESGGGGDIDVRLNADGYYGKGLRVQVSLPDTSSYGLVAFGFGRLDVTDYKFLTFYVRGTYGDEVANVYLNDGKKRAHVRLGQYLGVTKMWRKVSIPLLDFAKKGVDLSHLSQLVLAWEEQYISEQIIYFDDFVFE